MILDGVIYFTTTAYGMATPDEKTPPQDLPGLHAVKLQK